MRVEESKSRKVEESKSRRVKEEKSRRVEEHLALNTKHLTLSTKHLVLFCFLLLNSPMSVLCAQTAVGQWRDCLDYSMVLHVEPVGRYVYAAARGGVFCYDTVSEELTRMNKTTGLSDAGVATMAYDTATRTLVVAYNNSNIDLVKDGRV